MKDVIHPSRDQFSLPAVLDGLSDPIRLAVVMHIAEHGESACGDFLSLGSKTNLSYHIAKLREAGILQTRVSGVYRYVTIRWDDLEFRFPGLMQTLLVTAEREGQALPAVVPDGPAQPIAPPKPVAKRRAPKAKATAR